MIPKVPEMLVENAVAFLVAALLLGGGFVIGVKWNAAKVHQQVEARYRDQIDDLAQTNANQSAEIKVLRVAFGLSATRESELRLRAEAAEKTARTRREWRMLEHEQSPECAAWLAAANPCRLQPAARPDR